MYEFLEQPSRAPRDSGMAVPRVAVALILSVIACTPSPPPDVFLPTYRPMSGGPLALIDGTLAEEDGCLWIDSVNGRHLVLWPSGSSVVDVDGQRVVHNDGNRAVVGTHVSAVGGEYGPENYRFVVELIGREVPEPCRATGRYWLGF